MSVYNNTYDNEINVPLSMTGEKKLKVSQIDFDTSCDCQVTACDGGTIKFCAPVHFDPVPWPPHPEPGGHGACPPGVPLDLVVTKKIEFDTSGTCQIESCPVVTDPITMCSPLILTKELGTCTIPVPKVFLERLEFDAGSLPYHIVSCDVISRPINFGSPAVFKDFVVLADTGIGTCVTPVPEIVTKKLKFGGVSACQIESCTPSTPITFCSPVIFNNGFTFTGDICDDSGGASFEYFNAFDAYYIEKNGATCAAPSGKRIKVIDKFEDMITHNLSTILLNDNGTVGNGYITIHSTSSQPHTNPLNYGIDIHGGTLSNTKNILMSAAWGEIDIAATEDIKITAGNSLTPGYSKILMSSEGDTTITSNQGTIGLSANLNIEATTTTGDIDLTSGQSFNVDSAATTGLVSYHRTTILSSHEDVVLESQQFDVLLTCASGSLTSNTGTTNLTSINDTNITSTDASINIAAKEWDAKVNLEAGDALAGFAIELPPDEAPSNTTKQQATRVLYPTNLGSTSYTVQGVDQNARPYIIGGNGDTNPSPPLLPFPGTPPSIPAINSNPYGRRIDRVNTKRTNVYIYPRSTSPATWPVPYNPTDTWPGDQRGDIIYAYTSGNQAFNNIIQYLCVRSYDGGGNGEYWWRLRTSTQGTGAGYPPFFATW